MQSIQFGETGRKVSRVGLGGEGVLRTFGRSSEATRVIETALEQQITYFDSARAYSGSEAYLGEVWTNRPHDRKRIFQTSKSAMRTRDEALQELEKTLANLGTDHLDLWQIHDVRTHDELDRIAGSGGALEGFITAREAGKVRHIGVTGHHDPEVLTRAVTEWPVDSVMLPVNPVEAVLGGFLDTTLPAARERGIAVVGMKVFGAGHYLFPEQGVTAELLLRFALSQPVTLVIVGCSTPGHVRTLASSMDRFDPLSEQEQQSIVQAFSQAAEQLAYYRGTL